MRSLVAHDFRKETCLGQSHIFKSAAVMSSASIVFDHVYVDGVNTILRASSLKQWFVNRGKSSSSRISILKDISFTAEPGDRIGVVGGNGSGKSSLLRVIAGIYPPSQGEIKVQGRVAPLIEMGVVFDQAFTARQNIRIGLTYSGRGSDYNEKIENDIIEFSELKEKIDMPIKVFSSGMQARLAFSIAVFQNPDILLLDEAFATGDREFIAKSRKLMRERFSSVPIAMLVSHSQELIEQMCTRCLWIDKGRLVMDGPAEEVVKAYANSQKAK